MGLARIKTWLAGDVLTAADQNAEFNNILNNPITLVSPTTGAINFQSSVAHTNLTITALSASSGSVGSVLILSTAASPIPLWSLGATAGGLFIASTATLPTWLSVGPQSNVLAVTSSGMPAWTGSPSFNSSGLAGTLLTSAGGTGRQENVFTSNNITLGGGWSTAGALTGIRGGDLALSFNIVTSGIGAGKPFVTTTYTVVATALPVTFVQFVGGFSTVAPPALQWTVTQNTSGMSATVENFTPSSGVTYTVNVLTLA